jgi:hypothetical protein
MLVIAFPEIITGRCHKIILYNEIALWIVIFIASEEEYE